VKRDRALDMGLLVEESASAEPEEDEETDDEDESEGADDNSCDDT